MATKKIEPTSPDKSTEKTADETKAADRKTGRTNMSRRSHRVGRS